MTIIAKWQSRGGKYRIELLEETFTPNCLVAGRYVPDGMPLISYSYNATGGNGNLGDIRHGMTHDKAIERCERIAAHYPSKMTRII